MSLLEKAYNSIQYQINKAISDPEADKYAKEQADKAKKQQDAAIAADIKNKTKAEHEENLKKEKLKMEAEQKAAKDRSTFSFTRLFGTVFGSTITILLIFLIFFGAVVGASMATNLNLYRSLPYRIFYAIYGFLFFFIVIPYVIGYRWLWKGKKPKFYSLIPIIPYHLDNKYAALLFSWLSYKPDDQIDSLKEWIKEQGQEA